MFVLFMAPAPQYGGEVERGTEASPGGRWEKAAVTRKNGENRNIIGESGAKEEE